MTERERIIELLNTAGRTNLGPKSLPVLTKVSSGIQYLGNVATHQDAELMGLMCGVSCTKISRAKVDGDERIFFLLH